MKEAIEIKVNPTTPEYQRFEKLVRDQYERYMAANFPRNPVESIVADFGPKYVKIRKVGVGINSVYIFVDRTNGDVLKPACHRAPAKHARGNIFNADNGMGCVGVWGVACLR